MAKSTKLRAYFQYFQCVTIRLSITQVKISIFHKKGYRLAIQHLMLHVYHRPLVQNLPDFEKMLVHNENELVGFVIIDKKGSEAGIDFNVAQFFILRKFKNKGIGRYVAQQCFNKFQGAWEVMVIPSNTGAYDFWKSIIKNYTSDNFEEYTRKVVHLSNSKKKYF